MARGRSRSRTGGRTSRVRFFTLLAVLVTLVLVTLGLCVNLRSLEDPAPLIHFEMSSLIDSYLCPFAGKEKITAAWTFEAERKLPELQKRWDTEGPKLLEATAHVVGHPFAFDEKTVRLFLCPSLTGWGLPVIVPLRHYLKVASADGVRSDEEFVDAVFHELLHTYVAREVSLVPPSPHLRAHVWEAPYVLIHLHLYAVQKIVYQNLALSDRWAQVVRRAKTFPPAYSRALEIVEAEGAESYVKELRN